MGTLESEVDVNFMLSNHKNKEERKYKSLEDYGLMFILQHEQGFSFPIN
ncbi:hypothetical protein DB313_05450 (plasmid) [Borrelia turcica IST7]|uniref:Uncharacterized protein n=1 Tax=Borrelia turcica IST7 TaxID=1104446 RepID=A0A386PPK9_9SPIR|nr:hypothetical protein DB313_05450 [Borrelia turcica IST7]